MALQVGVIIPTVLAPLLPASHVDPLTPAILQQSRGVLGEYSSEGIGDVAKLRSPSQPAVKNCVKPLHCELLRAAP